MRVVFLFISVLFGLLMGFGAGEWQPNAMAVGAAAGAVLSGGMLFMEYSLRQFPARMTLGGGIGLGSGVLLAGLLLAAVSDLVPRSTGAVQLAALSVFVIFPYLGLIVGIRYGKDGGRLDRGLPGARLEERPPAMKLLDTSVIIDGRIAELCETGFLEGTFIVPQFILQELQNVADSADSLMRARGRRGLDILNHVQKNQDVEIQILEDDFPHVKEVDAKLVELAKKLDAKILTNDLNLNKVAVLQGVQVLNINELSNALKPVVLPGETLRVFVLKEGKEADQGVAYLDDGTMVVVDHAKRCIGKNVDGIVTSVLQTSAGRMIFTRLKDSADQDRLSFSRG